MYVHTMPPASCVGIGEHLHFRLQRRAFRLGGHVGAIAVAIEFPAVVDAADAALLVAAEEHRRAPVRTIRVDEADDSVGVAEREEVFAQKPHAHRRAVLLGQFLRQGGGNPVAAEQFAHGRSASHARDPFVILRLEHLRRLLRRPRAFTRRLPALERRVRRRLRRLLDLAQNLEAETFAPCGEPPFSAISRVNSSHMDHLRVVIMESGARPGPALFYYPQGSGAKIERSRADSEHHGSGGGDRR